MVSAGAGAMKYVFLLFVAVYGVGVAAQQQCAECDRSQCPSLPPCPGAEAMDECGCCVVCRRSLGQRCDGPGQGVQFGPCGQYLSCEERSDVVGGGEWWCQCRERGEVCGSDGRSYPSLCGLLEIGGSNLTVAHQGPCPSKPVIKSAPSSSTRRLGGILVLDCEAAGVPVPEIYWELYRPDGKSMLLPNDDPSCAVQTRGGPEPFMVTGWVQIMKMTRESVGTYVCNAKNRLGVTKAMAKISYVGQENEIH